MSQDLSPGYDDDKTGDLSTSRSSALANKLTGVLSVSYADSEIRDSLRLLDLKDVQNTPDLRRKLRQDLQKDVIDCNSSIVQEFGHVAEVGSLKICP